jgi:hypothetical protein
VDVQVSPLELAEAFLTQTSRYGDSDAQALRWCVETFGVDADTVRAAVQGRFLGLEMRCRLRTGKPSHEFSHDVMPFVGPRYEAMRDWIEGRAYLDNAGNYRVRAPGSNRGRVAWWNRAAKRRFPDASQLHHAAHRARTDGLL